MTMLQKPKNDGINVMCFYHHIQGKATKQAMQQGHSFIRLHQQQWKTSDVYHALKWPLNVSNDTYHQADIQGLSYSGFSDCMRAKLGTVQLTTLWFFGQRRFLCFLHICKDIHQMINWVNDFMHVASSSVCHRRRRRRRPMRPHQFHWPNNVNNTDIHPFHCFYSSYSFFLEISTPSAKSTQQLAAILVAPSDILPAQWLTN